MFEKILIANRGEIACRIISTAGAMGIRTVAVYSTADADALHVKLADEAVCIGAAPATESYLNACRIIEAAQTTGAQAIHPGYGFLSENTAFADACAKAGITFIGPSADAIEAMGDKGHAKALMIKAGVPTVPGVHGETDVKKLHQAAAKIGYPVLLKAVAGGGGKGMRLVEKDSEFADALAGAQREAKSSFGNAEVLIEKYLVQPRHVEIQIVADSHGNCVYLFERDCSLQRRHQKVVEEAPAPHLPAKIRAAMGEAACKAALAVGYVGVGTIEFLLDVDHSFYFMEMNTRLQVEHPVTEAITGVDMVALQFALASGEELPFTQDELAIDGHAIEVRLYAEDPAKNFLPGTGMLLLCDFPEQSENVRIDTGVTAGDTISHYYDPMIAKIIAWGEDRADALRHLRTALGDVRIAGVQTNLDYLRRILALPAFAAGEVQTGLLGALHEQLTPHAELPTEALTLAALFTALERQALAAEELTRAPEANSPWHNRQGWRLGGYTAEPLHFKHGELDHSITLQGTDNPDVWRIGGQPVSGYLLHDEVTAHTPEGKLSATVVRDGHTLYLLSAGWSVTLTTHPAFESGAEDDAVLGSLTAPIPGVVVKVAAKVGAKVVKGAPLMVLEAMKTEHHILAPVAGQVDAVHFNEGDHVEKDAVLIAFTPEASEQATDAAASA